MYRRIYIEINNICNFKCDFCPYPLIETKKENMDFDRIKEIIVDIHNNVPYDIIYFHNLNEPLLHPKIDNIIRFCDENNVRYGLTTNGVLLNKHLNVIANSKMKELNISYQVATEIGNQNRGNKLTLHQYRNNIIKSIKSIKNTFNGQIKIKLLITDKKSYFNNKKITGIEKHYDLIKEIDMIYYELLNKHLDSIQINKIKSLEIGQFCKICLIDDIYIELFPFLTWGNYYDKIFKAQWGGCDGIKGQLLIKSNGELCPCCYDFTNEIKMGNVFVKPISQILKSEMVINIYRNLQATKLFYNRCKVCLGNKSFFINIKNNIKALLNKEIESRFLYSNNTIYL